MQHLLAICLVCVAYFGISIGYLLMKRAIDKDGLLGLEWFLGAVLFCVFELVKLGSYAMAPVSIIACFSGFSYIINMLLAPLMVPGEKWCRSIIVYTILLTCICTGIVAIYPDVQTKSISVAKLGEVLYTPLTVSYATVSVMVSIATMMHMVGRYRRGEKPNLFCIGAVQAIGSASSILFIKSAWLIQEEHKGITAALLLIGVAFAFVSFVLMNVAFQHYSALVVVPVMGPMTQILRIVLCGFVFHEFDDMNTIRAFWFSAGVSAAVFVSFLLGLDKKQTDRTFNIFLHDCLVDIEKRPLRSARSSARSSVDQRI